MNHGEIATTGHWRGCRFCWVHDRYHGFLYSSEKCAYSPQVLEEIKEMAWAYRAYTFCLPEGPKKAIRMFFLGEDGE